MKSGEFEGVSRFRIFKIMPFKPPQTFALPPFRLNPSPLCARLENPAEPNRLTPRFHFLTSLRGAMGSSDVQRKLTAILCADVVGYSRLIGEIECRSG